MAPAARLRHVYFLFIGGSSTNWTQKPLGLRFVALLITLIFMAISPYATWGVASFLAISCARDTNADSKAGL